MKHRDTIGDQQVRFAYAGIGQQKKILKKPKGENNRNPVLHRIFLEKRGVYIDSMKKQKKSSGKRNSSVLSICSARCIDLSLPAGLI